MNTGMPNKYRYTYNTWVEQGEMEWTRRGTIKPAPTPALIGLISEWAALWPDLSEIYCSYIFSPCEFVDHNYSLFSRLLIARSFWNNLKMTLTLHNSVRSVRLLYTPHNTRHKNSSLNSIRNMQLIASHNSDHSWLVAHFFNKCM